MDGSQNNALITIGDTRMPVVEYRNRRVVIFAMMDQVHQRPKRIARKRFHDHRRKLIEGEDYFQLSFQEIASLDEFSRAGLNRSGLLPSGEDQGPSAICEAAWNQSFQRV